MAYRPGLDGVRALAVVAVLAYHDGRIQGGFLGVSIFFTLSGFLITLLLLTERERRGAVSLRAFFGRRLRRLMPAALAGVALAAVVTPAVAGARGAPGLRGDALAAVGNVANWRFVAAGDSYAETFAAPSALGHYWSLAVEEQFYLVLAPLLVALLALGRGRRHALVAGVVILAAASVLIGAFVAGGSIDRAYYGTDARAAEFLIGALVAVAYGRRVLARVAVHAGPVALVGLAWAAFNARVNDPDLFRGGLVLHAAGAAVVVVAACEPGPVRSICSVAPLRAVGRISYGLYVYHWPLFLYFDTTSARVVSTVAVATASYHLLERPFREGRIPRRWSWAIAPAGAVAVAAVVAVGIARTAPPAIVFEPAASGSPAPFISSVPDRRMPDPPALPATGTGPPGTRVLVVGDSVALTLGRGIERWGTANGVEVMNGGALGCTLLYDAEVRGYWGTAHRAFDPCQTDRTWPAALTEFAPDVVVVLFGAWDVYDASFDGGATWHTPGDPEWNRRYELRVDDAQRRLAATGASVLWLAPPCFTTPPGERAESREWLDPARVAVQRAIAERAAARTGVTVSATLATSECPVDLSVRPDGVHFSDAGADAATDALAPEITHALRRDTGPGG